MNNREMLYRGLSCAAWGYLFLNFDFNLGRISILPRFVGFLFLLCAINSLFKERDDLLLLRPICIFFAAYYAVDWGLSFVGRGLDLQIVFLDLLLVAAQLYFHFQFLTDIAAVAENCPKDGEKFAARLRHCRTIYTLLSTAVALTGMIPSLIRANYGKIYSGTQKDILVLLGLLEGVTAVVIIVTLFGLKRCFQRGKWEGKIF